MTPAEQRRLRAAQAAALRDQTRLQRDTRAEILAQLREALNQVTLAIAAQPDEAVRWRLVDLQREIRRAMDEFATDARGIAGNASVASWAQGQALTDLTLAGGGWSIEGLQALDTRQLDAMRVFLTDKIRAISLEAADKINTQLGLSVMGVQSPFDTIKAVQKILGEDTRDRATVIVRTELGRAFSAAAQARLEEAAKTVPGLRKQWRRSGKVHSRFNHDLADGQVVDHDKPFVITARGGGRVELMYPRDPKAPPGETVNCGCSMLPVLPESSGFVPSVPGKKPFTKEELARNRNKAGLDDAVPVPR